MSKSLFHSIECAPDDPILGLPKLFQEDPRSNKVNLGIGSYMTAEGTSYLFPSVAKAERIIANLNEPKDYSPMEGSSFFLKRTIELNLGASDNAFALQTLGGTGSLSLAAEFLFLYYSKVIAISDPSWTNHAPLFQKAGFEVRLYPYYDKKSHSIPFDEIIKSLSGLPPLSVVLLQTACHNPTGADFSKEQWQTLMELIKEKQLFPLFDNAYQGFGDSIIEDRYPLELFQKNQVEMVIASAYSKNFGLYGERVGALIFSLNDPNLKIEMMSQLRRIIRSHYSSPPIQGAKIVEIILDDPSLCAEWTAELDSVRTRVKKMRLAFTKAIPSLDFIANGKGFFSMLGISAEQVLALRKEYAIYLPMNGRINLAGLTPSNIQYVTKSIQNIL